MEQDACDSNPDVQHPEPDTDGEDHAMESANEPANAKIRPVASGYVIQSPEMFIATPIDPLFLIIPSLLVTIAKNDPSSRGLFLSFDDIFEQRSEGSPHFSSIISHVPLQHTIIERMKIVCDMVTAGDEAMYRLNIDKLLTELLTKAQKMAALGLPPSMEEKFVRKALERPIMAIKREDSTASAGAESCVEDTRTADIASAEGDDSQASASTSGSTSSEASAATSVTIPDDKPPSQTPKDIEQLLRLKVALSYMFAAYMPQTLVTTLNAKLAAEDSPIDFKPLEKELSLISEMRREALASRSFADFSRKRGMEDEDAAASRAEKKAKKEEEEKKRKASETRGVRDLKKVDVSGMKKMSDFFTKKPTAIKKT